MQVRTFLNLLFFQLFGPFFFLICFLGLVKALEHDLFLCPLVTYFGFCFFGSDLGPFSLFLLFPFAGCFLEGNLPGFHQLPSLIGRYIYMEKHVIFPLHNVFF